MHEMPLTHSEAAAFLGITPNALKMRRCQGVGSIPVPGHKLGPVYVYWPDELEVYRDTVVISPRGRPGKGEVHSAA